MKSKRKNRDKKELVKASDHLFYEIRMLSAITEGFSSGTFDEETIKNALIESFAIHARALLEFIYAERPHHEDVIAEDFFKDPTMWERIKQDKTETIKPIKQRVNKEVAHLSYARQNVTEGMKKWPISQMGGEIIYLCMLFIKSIPKELLGPRWEGNLSKDHET